MSKRANTTVIGAFVIGAIALITGAVMIFGTGQFFHERVAVVTVFEGSVTGLDVGSPVEFRGVPVGTITGIKALYDPEEASIVIPVYMALNRRAITNIRGDETSRPPKQEIQRMIEHGLRARLDVRSIVTGTKFVSLDFRKDTPGKIVGVDKKIPEIPSIPSTLQKFTSMFEKLDLEELVVKATETFQGISALANSPALARTIENLDSASGHADELLVQLLDDSRRLSQTAEAAFEQTRESMANAEAALAATLADISNFSDKTDQRVARASERLEVTLSAVRALTEKLDREVRPLSDSAKATMEQAMSTLRAAESLIGEDSHTRYNLDTTLEELAAAARSIRQMAEYLEQHPDALLKGKGP